MRRESIQQFAIVRSDSASAFEEELNTRIRELAAYKPEVRFDGLTAYIQYRIEKVIPESVCDEYELKGSSFICEQCPCFEPILKRDGTEDKRIRYGECQFAEFGRTYKDSPACERLYQMLKSGEVGLCFTK